MALRRNPLPQPRPTLTAPNARASVGLAANRLLCRGGDGKAGVVEGFDQGGGVEVAGDGEGVLFGLSFAAGAGD